MCRGGQLRDTSEVSEMGVRTIQQFCHLDPFTHPLGPSVDHGETFSCPWLLIHQLFDKRTVTVLGENFLKWKYSTDDKHCLQNSNTSNLCKF